MIFTYNPQNYSYQNPGGPGGSQYGAPGTVNQNLFNQNSGVNWKDSTAFAYEQMAQREANALNIALMNYQNEYNSPLNQMLRYQQAGINPFDVVNKASAPAAAPPAAKASQASASYNQEAANRIALMNATVRNVSEIVDGILDTKKGLTELKYYDDTLRYQKNLIASKSFLGNEQYIGQLFSNYKNALMLYVLAHELGVDVKKTPFDSSPNILETYTSLFGDLDKGVDIQDDALYMSLKQALLDLRHTQKHTQEKQQSYLESSKTLAEEKAETERVNRAKMNITGWSWADRLIDALLN